LIELLELLEYGDIFFLTKTSRKDQYTNINPTDRVVNNRRVKTSQGIVATSLRHPIVGSPYGREFVGVLPP
jgi:hypothetical protein